MAAPAVMFILVASICLSSVVRLAEANALRGQDVPDHVTHSQSLLGELGQALGKIDLKSAQERASRIEETLRPTFQALPSTEEGRLRSEAVRYLLHRYFVDRHNWFVNGFSTSDEAWNSSTPMASMGKHFGSNAQEIFGQILNNQGLSLHEVALLAGTLEDFVHAETVQRLRETYRFSGLTSEDHVQDSDVVEIIDTYMMLYVIGLDPIAQSQEFVQRTRKMFDKVYPQWGQMQRWLREVRKEVLGSNPQSRNSFNTTVKVLEEISNRYGRWQDMECVQLKENLLKHEQPGTGRVPLANFYGAALNGSWQFSESIAYLRQLGALDETDPAHPGVIIPNYVNALSNCVASSEYYSVCCINECEGLLAHVEQQLAAPDAFPYEIVEIVEALPSATVDAPRKLSSALIDRLHEIAVHHDGHVPLHGRLFMQWLHHAYPRECPFPHTSGTQVAQTQDEWIKETGQKATVDASGMREHIEQIEDLIARRQTTDTEEADLPWIAEEELFAGKSDRPRSSSSAAGRSIMMLGVAGSAVVAILRMFRSVQDAWVPQSQHKLLV